MPLAIDLFCGLGGWAEGLLAEGWDVIGFDVEQHIYGEHRYPASLFIQDVLTLHRSQFRNADLIVASPPCQEYSYMAMPWKLAKAKAAAIRADTTGKMLADLNRLFDACFRIQAQASLAAGRHVPMVVENVRGAIPWVGRSRWNFGSYHLWGDVPALMPATSRLSVLKPQAYQRRHGTGSWFAIDMASARAGVTRPSEIKTVQHPNICDGHAHTKHLTNPDEHTKLGGTWFHGYRKGQGPRNHGSNSKGRKRASAMIAKIPLPLSRHIAATFRPN